MGKKDVQQMATKARKRQFERETLRDKVAKERDDRVQKRSLCLIADAQRKKADHERWLQAIDEKKLDKCKATWNSRGGLFSGLFEEEKALTEALEREKEMAITEQEVGEVVSPDSPKTKKKKADKPSAMNVVEEAAREKLETYMKN